MSREIELKLDVDPGGAERVRAAPLLRDAPCSSADHDSTYYDTPDAALARAGFSFRVRRSGERTVQTLKRQPGAAAGLFDRGEWEWELGQEAAPAPGLAADTPAAPLLGGELVPVLSTRFSRSVWRIDRDGARLEVALDEGAVRSDGRSAELVELELELRGGDPAALFDAALAVAASAPLRIGVLSKAERGRRLADGRLGKAAKSEPVAFDPAASVAEGFAAIAHACLRHYRLNEAVLLSNPDPTALHQARVAMRRLRSSLPLFGRVLREDEYPALREELRWLTGQLGDARNLDVFTRRLKKPGKRAAAGEEDVRAALSAAREEAYARALGAIGSERARALVLGLVRWVEIGEWRGRGKARRPLAGFAAGRLDRRWERVAAAGEMLAALDEEARHRLRIDVKKMRYAAEFLVSLHGGRGQARRREAFLAAAEDLQESLGTLNDAATAREIVERLPLDGAPARGFAETLIGREPDQGKCIAAAKKAFGRMRAAGPYWRG